MRRPLVALAAVAVVIASIAWVLVQQPDPDDTDASVPYVTRDDDSYITASSKPIASTESPTAGPSTTPDPTPSSPAPSRSAPSEPVPSSLAPSGPARPGPDRTSAAIPSSRPTAGRPPRTTGPTEQTTVPGGVPTGGPDTIRPTGVPSSADSSPEPEPTGDSSEPVESSPAPTDDGGMTSKELQLFTLIDDRRRSRGCAPLGRDTSLTQQARSDADQRADDGDVSGGGSSLAAAGGDGWDAQDAFEAMMDRNAGTVLNCGLRELGVGRGTETRCSLIGLGSVCLGTKIQRVGWVADFE